VLLFIFNFKVMLKKICLVAVLLFISYAVFVSSFAPKWWSASQNQWQANIIKAQKFICGNTDTVEKVIVGTSLSYRLVMDSLPGTYNLSFSGQSIYDGLNILVHKEKIPTIFIEMNVALFKENEDFTSALSSPVLFYPKKEIRALREDKQPIAIIGNKMSVDFMDHFIMKCKYFFHLQPQQSGEQANGNELFEKMLQLQVKEYSKIPDHQLVMECFNELERYIRILEQMGTRIVFFEMPVNKQLKQLPKAKMIRETFYNKFPEGKYMYIPMPDSIAFKTTDGVHLDEQEALTYTRYLKSKIKNPVP
jgi:hypothetical protein